MKIGYTEFSFGYAFTENLIRSTGSRPAGAPVFPNLIQEGQLGYDVHIDLPGCPLFFQYKLPELMVRRSAKEISQYRLAGIRAPFFRMPLMRRDLSNQHAILLRTEQQFPNAVYYATPCIAGVNGFNAAYNAGRVHIVSALFSPSDIGPLPDDKHHVIAYRGDLRHAWFCSEPRKIAAFELETVDDKIKGLFGKKRFKTLEVAAESIRRDVLRLAPSQLREAESAIRDRVRTRGASALSRPGIPSRTRRVTEELLVSREIARIALGMDMIVAQPAS